jgi:hypothetical protein
MCTFAPLFNDLTMLSTTIQERWWNTRFLLLFGLAVVNLLFMHGQMAMTVEYEYPFKVDAILSNVFSCLIDTTFFFLLSMLLGARFFPRSNSRQAPHISHLCVAVYMLH